MRDWHDLSPRMFIYKRCDVQICIYLHQVVTERKRIKHQNRVRQRRPYKVCRCRELPSRPIVFTSVDHFESRDLQFSQNQFLAQYPLSSPLSSMAYVRRRDVHDVTRLRHRFVASREQNRFLTGIDPVSLPACAHTGH
jgi:hypothetical protein